jgi:hypothetical protein
MKRSTAFVTTLFALASFPLLAQQPPPANQPLPSSPAAPPVEMSSVSGELVAKLDSKTAKVGDSVEIQTRSAVTANGTEIPKGSKLVGHVLAVRPSAAGANSQVALQFDHAELKGGQSVPVYSQIQSIAPAGGAASTNSAAKTPSASAPSNPSASGGSRASGGGSMAPGGDPGTAPTASSAPAPGTIVGRDGNIAILATSIAGVAVANNAPGQHDPRLGQSSGILLGAKQDIELDGGTQMVLGVSGTAGAGQ